MFDVEKFEKTIVPAIGPYLRSVPFDVAREELYSAKDLFGGFDPARPESRHDCLDAKVAAHVESFGKNRRLPALEMNARSMHDYHVRAALYRLLEWFEQKKVVGVMGGHALLRTDAYYRRVVETAKELTERGSLVISGGGPGAMVATHLGAWLAGRPASDVDAALEILSSAPGSRDELWLSAAFEVMAAFPQEKGFVSVSIPTWHYSDEPPAPFATYIAKLFDNSVREDLLLTESFGGVVFMPGGAGTLQEIFQDAVQNHYVTLGMPSPMVFVGHEFWTEKIPVYPFVKRLVENGRYKNLAVSLAETTDEIIYALEKGA